MQQRSEETRTRLLEAALKRFANHGYNAASVDDICADAGVSKGAFYHHFPSKQAVFLALLDGWLETIDLGLKAAHQETVPETLLRMTAVLPAVLASADERLPMFLEFWLQASRDEAIWQATIAPYHRYQAYFAALIQAGIEEGSFAPVDPQAAARTVLAMAVGFLLQGLLDPRGANWETIVREGMEIILKGLRA
ncbi:MAG: TetR/AcrR family transcriptional regulator [Anaerolineales bacterium]